MNQRPGPIAGGGMDGQPCGLHEHDEVMILVQDIQIHRFRRRGVCPRHGNAERIGRTGLDLGRRVGQDGAVDRQMPALDQRLDA